MFISSKEFDFEDRPDIFEYVIKKYPIAILEDRLYIDIKVKGENERDDIS